MAGLRRHTKSCRHCGVKQADGFSISATGQCEPCSERVLLDNIEQMAARSGPNFERWRRRMAASVGAILPDDGEQVGER